MPYSEIGREDGVPVTASYLDKDSGKPSSILISMLPAVLQARLPKLRSIRHSAVELRGRASPAPTNVSTPHSSSSSFTTTVVGSKSPSLLSYDEGIVRDRVLGRERKLSIASTLPMFQMTEVNSGINWKYACQGSSMLNQSFEESSAANTLSDNPSPSFCRDLYIHALTYLLRALPTNLNQTELLSIQSALPTPIVNSIEVNVAQKELVPYLRDRLTADGEPTPSPPSVVHRAIASIILQTFIFGQLLLPYIRIFVASAYQYERQHRISERVFAMSIGTVDGIGHRGIKLADRICAMNDGKVGQAINNLTIWWVTSVTGGIHQGVKDAVIILREDSKQ